MNKRTEDAIMRDAGKLEVPAQGSNGVVAAAVANNAAAAPAAAQPAVAR
jgi:hypothetical protein